MIGAFLINKNKICDYLLLYCNATKPDLKLASVGSFFFQKFIEYSLFAYFVQ